MCLHLNPMCDMTLEDVFFAHHAVGDMRTRVEEEGRGQI